MATLRIPLDKAKNLAREITFTCHAGSSTAMMLNNLIVIAEKYHRADIPIYSVVSGESATIENLYKFFDGVRMLDA